MGRAVAQDPDGRVKSRAAESNIRERQALENSMYVAEGGRLMANDAARAVSGSFSLPSCVDDEIEANGHPNVDGRRSKRCADR
jgi:hypothetical protein